MTTNPDVSVALVTLGCARNDVDSEELAGRLAADGFRLVDDPADAETVVVNTCGFVEAAKKDSVDTLLAASDLKQDGRTRAVVAVGCLAERYGKDLAESLPEADAVLGFDDYPDIAARLRSILAGDVQHPHTPQDRRKLLPITPTDRDASAVSVPGHGIDDLGVGAPASGPRAVRRRLVGGPMAPLKLASGCDRRCSFCAIPSFRGSFVSRRPPTSWPRRDGWPVRVSASCSWSARTPRRTARTSATCACSRPCCPSWPAIDGVERVRVSYLQPAETRPGLVEAIAQTAGVSDYFDLSFQHASATVLRRMRRFGDPESFLELLDRVRSLAPAAGARSNVIVGFPGETDDDLETLCDFLVAARLDVTGVFGYSDEDGTEAETLDGKLDDDEIRARVEHVTDLVEQLTSERAESRIGEDVVVLVESVADGVAEGRADHQGPEVDGTTRLTEQSGPHAVGDLVSAVVVGSDGADLVATPVRVGAGVPA